jgi:hypothetical protein
MGETLFVAQVALPVFCRFLENGRKQFLSYYILKGGDSFMFKEIYYWKPVLWIRIRMDPHSFGCSRSGSVMGMRIRIQEHGN